MHIHMSHTHLYLQLLQFIQFIKPVFSLHHYKSNQAKWTSYQSPSTTGNCKMYPNNNNTNTLTNSISISYLIPFKLRIVAPALPLPLPLPYLLIALQSNNKKKQAQRRLHNICDTLKESGRMVEWKGERVRKREDDARNGSAGNCNPLGSAAALLD